MSDDAVDAHAIWELLPQEADGGLGDNERVGGIDALLRVCRRMRGLAAVLHTRMRHRERPRLGDIDWCWVSQHGQVESRERATVEHLDLSAAAFLGRCPVELD